MTLSKWKIGIILLIVFSGIIFGFLVFYAFTNRPTDTHEPSLYTKDECVSLFENYTVSTEIKTKIIDRTKPYMIIQRKTSDPSANVTALPNNFLENNRELKDAFGIADILYDRYTRVPFDCQSFIIDEIDYTINVSPNELINLMRIDPSISQLYLDEDGNLKAPTSPSFHLRNNDKLYGVGIFLE